MISKLLFAVVMAVGTAGLSAQAITCVKGKPCGKACISVNDVCHKDGSSAQTVQKAERYGRETAATHKVKSCRKGKPCGNTCIAENAVCHQ